MKQLREGLMGATCEITALVAGSTFKTALQHGQPTSKGWEEDFAIGKLYAKKHSAVSN